MTKVSTVLGLLQVILVAVANVVLVHLAHRAVMLPYMRRYFSLEYFGITSQALFVLLLLGASVVNGASLSTGLGLRINLPAAGRALLASVPSLFTLVNVLVHNLSFRAAMGSPLAFWAIVALIGGLICYTCFVSADLHSRLLTSGHKKYLLVLTANPIVYLALAMILVFAITPGVSMALRICNKIG